MKKLVLLVAVLLVSVTFTYAQFTFTSIDFPGGTLTTARGINNNGEIVGAYRIVPPRHALLIKGGQYIPLAPTTVLGTNYSEAFKNNDRGDVVGEYLDDAGFAHGFLLSKKGMLTQLDFPAASDTYAYGINESGTVVGQWDLLDSNGNVIAQHGFTWENGSFTQVDYPGSANTTVFGINARGDLVGEWDDNVVAHGFIRTKQGQFTSYDVPVAGATLTQLTGINANGQILGVYIDAGGAEHGFLEVGATFTSIDYPGAVTTTAWGINSAGQIVGNHYGSDGIAHGWLAERSNHGPKAANWSQFRFNPEHTGSNPFENILNPTTVGSLDVQWKFRTTYSSLDGQPTVAEGVVYVGAYFDYNVYALNASTGALLWQYATGGVRWTLHRQWLTACSTSDRTMAISTL